MQTPITPRRVLAEAPRYEVGLTDGWYGVKAQLDPHLEALIDRGRIVVGAKLRVVGAEVERYRYLRAGGRPTRAEAHCPFAPAGPFADDQPCRGVPAVGAALGCDAPPQLQRHVPGSMGRAPGLVQATAAEDGTRGRARGRRRGAAARRGRASALRLAVHGRWAAGAKGSGIDRWMIADAGAASAPRCWGATELPDGTRITRSEQEEHRARQQHMVRSLDRTAVEERPACSREPWSDASSQMVGPGRAATPARGARRRVRGTAIRSHDPGRVPPGEPEGTRRKGRCAAVVIASCC